MKKQCHLIIIFNDSLSVELLLGFWNLQKPVVCFEKDLNRIFDYQLTGNYKVNRRKAQLNFFFTLLAFILKKKIREITL